MKRKWWIGLACAGAAALLFWRPGVHAAASESLYPYEKARVWLKRTVGVRLRAVFSRVGHASRNAMLERDLARLRMEAARAGALEAEAARLRALLGFPPPAPGRCLPAAVLSRGGTTAVWQTLRAARGSRDGVRRGDPALSPDGVVGRVADVSPHTCEVMLISDPNCRVACELELPADDAGAVRGILYGGGARPGADPELTLLYVVEPLRLRYLDRDFEPPPRTRVVTSGLGRVFPRGLTVGFLLDSSVRPDALVREASVAPAADLAGLEEVFILASAAGGAGGKGGGRAR